eukprot:CAMPEP_0178391554 /NCGR_PEP_ID=MMETSP0689_2-20121128/11225_1 /TAXON_ID=160604 /ORGANISM="Amphidinium massartii, Strain CS-259" /LENGTH=462 /DNA_ID=CAMNT_0020012105 /DNA_START=68 /DNA_END=1456 /DNA_ORIENTATION=+
MLMLEVAVGRLGLTRSRTTCAAFLFVGCLAMVALAMLSAMPNSRSIVSTALADAAVRLQVRTRPTMRRIHRRCEKAAAKLTEDDFNKTCDAAPNPWRGTSYLDAFAFPDQVRPLWRCQQLNFLKAMTPGGGLVAKSAHRRSCEVARRLVHHGLRVSNLGLDFGEVFEHCDGSSSYTCASRMRDLKEVARVYQADLGDGSCPNCVDIVVKDHELRMRSRPLSMLVEGQRDRLQQFLRDGFTLFPDLGFNVEALRAEVEAHLEYSLPGDAASGAVARKLETLAPLLQDDSFQQLASFYLGSSVVMSGYKIHHLGQQVSADQYISGHWHNDGCGSRLKLFVYLDDVRENGHPTEIARGTQRLAYYNYGYAKTEHRRYNTDYVNSEYEVVPMLGNKGGGFMFDTNTVHRGNVVGRQLSRDVVIIDFESIEKMQHRPKLGTSSGCPDQDLFPVGTEYSFPAGQGNAA